MQCSNKSIAVGARNSKQ